MSEFNTEVVISTLQKVVTILETNHIEYRFLGSVVVAAVNGRLHRKLGDLDLLVDSKGKNVLYAKLSSLGYYPAKGIFAFARRYLCLETVEHPTLLGVGFFCGKWKSDGTFVMGNKNVNLIIEPRALEKTNYILRGVHFVGIPERSLATGIMASKNNPKRQKELLILNEKRITPFPNDYLHISIYGLKMDWLYHLSMTALNLLGGIRVKLGMAFDPWR